ncbi:MAG: L-threonylcarbamoyladenylate synthase [Acidimicrobiales bacterium]|nr:L-threonylcarbamoyladenylate synthase [Acidimicrobiales bacterium]
MTAGARPEVTTDPERAVAVLGSGGLVAIPTETVYGLAADATRPEAVRAVFAAKGRPSDHPLIVHVAGADELDRWAADVPGTARALVDRWWPGPLTVLLRRSSRVLDEVTGGRDTVALRSPAHRLAHAVLEGFGGGLVAPSANRFGRVSPTTAADVVAELGARVDLVLDGGPCEVGVESTIVDLSGGVPVVLRQGGVSAGDIEAVLGVHVQVAEQGATPVAPGMLASHYAPDARVVVLDPETGAPEVAQAIGSLADGGADGTFGVLAPEHVAGLDPSVVQLAPAGDAVSYARVLYSRLREADTRGIDCLVVVPPRPEGIGAAVLDRLTRAAHRP